MHAGINRLTTRSAAAPEISWEIGEETIGEQKEMLNPQQNISRDFVSLRPGRRITTKLSRGGRGQE